MTKKQIKLLKELEIRLHYAHQTIRALNKDIHCDDGQEYPVPVIDKNGKVEFGDNPLNWEGEGY